jgi:hypothetical protein
VCDCVCGCVCVCVSVCVCVCACVCACYRTLLLADYISRVLLFAPIYHHHHNHQPPPSSSSSSPPPPPPPPSSSPPPPPPPPSPPTHPQPHPLQEYRRPAPEVELDRPEILRPISVLQMTMDHICSGVSDIHSFLAATTTTAHDICRTISPSRCFAHTCNGRARVQRCFHKSP